MEENFIDQTPEKEKINQLGNIILQVGSLMQSNGASTARIRITIDRIATAYEYTANVFIMHRALTLTLLNKAEEPVFNSTKRTAPVGVNFKIITAISRLSFRIKEKTFEYSYLHSELNRIAQTEHYPRLLVLLMVAFADACFCRLANGNIKAMAVSFIATFFGLIIRQEATKMKFNPYLCILFASLTASIISGGLHKLLPDWNLEPGFATSVLFLIPGVPLINSFIDIIDGNLLNGAIRFINGLIISFMIALGMITSIILFNI